MAPVFLLNVDRPGLAGALAERGLVAVRPHAHLAAHPTVHGAVAGISGVRNGLPPSAASIGWGVPFLHLIDGGEDAVIAALDGGADDALSIQSSDALVAARVGAIIRRGAATRWVRIGDLRIDMLECQVSRADRSITLLPREYRLLLVLARAAGQVVSRQTLVSALCGLRFDPGTNVIEVHVSRLRAKIDRGFVPALLHTVRGQGYRLAALPHHPHNVIADTATAR